MTEQQPYEVLEILPGFELRVYPAHLVAQVTVHATLDAAGSTAFHYLFGYISGENTPAQDTPAQRAAESAGSRADIMWGPAGSAAQTAPPVLHVRIPMTAPVLLQPADSGSTCTVAFVLPVTVKAGAAPVPDDPAVSVVLVPESRGAAATFSGRWTDRNYSDHAEALGESVADAGFAPQGRPRFALFDAPYKPWFLRRNEVIQTVL